MGNAYAIQYIAGPLAGTWYKIRDYVVRMNKAKAAKLAGLMNRETTICLATRYPRSKERNQLQIGDVSEW